MNFIYYGISSLAVAVFVMSAFSFISNWNYLQSDDGARGVVVVSGFEYMHDSLHVIAGRAESAVLKEDIVKLASEISRDLALLEKSRVRQINRSKNLLSSNVYMTGFSAIFSFIMVIILGLCRRRFL